MHMYIEENFYSSNSDIFKKASKHNFICLFYDVFRLKLKIMLIVASFIQYSIFSYFSLKKISNIKLSTKIYTMHPNIFKTVYLLL